MNRLMAKRWAIGLLPVWLLWTATVGGQSSQPATGKPAQKASATSGSPSDTPSLHPFGVPSGQTQPVASGSATGTGPSPSGTTGSGPSALSRPAWLPAEPTVPPFPGSALFNDRAPFLAGVKVNHNDLTYREGETLSMEFTAEREAYLYLLYHQADGTSLLLFPNEAQIDCRVAARQWVAIPPAGDDFRFRVSAPFGTEVLQVLATLKPAGELDALVQKTGRAASVSQDVINSLHNRLRNDLDNWTEHRVPIRTVSQTQQVASRQATRVGLFVGVNKFEAAESKHPANNERFRMGAELMAQTMIDRGGLDRQKTKTLVGEQATRDNIETAITRWLPSVTQPGDTVFIFYAAHGALIKNVDGTKPDGKDGVLTTYNNGFQSQKLSEDDWDAQARQHFISDGALARWLQELPGRQIALIISSCHAGSMIDAKLLAKFASREAARVKGISALNVTVLASCAPDESTLSDPKKPVWLATYLAEAMTRLPAPVTLQRAFDYYRQAHRTRLQQDGGTGFHEPVLTDTALLPIVLAP